MSSTCMYDSECLILGERKTRMRRIKFQGHTGEAQVLGEENRGWLRWNKRRNTKE